jgi:hypothetical protein
MAMGSPHLAESTSEKRELQCRRLKDHVPGGGISLPEVVTVL